MGIIKKIPIDKQDEAVKKGDYTGGYNFLNWLIFLRYGYIIYSVVTLGMLSYCIYDDVTIGIWLCIAMFLIFVYNAINDYTKAKKGIKK